MKRAAIRRGQREREKVNKNKSAMGVWMRAEQAGQRNGMVISLCTVIDSLYTDYNWSDKQINDFTDNLTDHMLKGSPQIIEFAVKPWQERLLEQINEQGKVNMKVNSLEKKIEYENRNNSYVSYCGYMLLNLYSNFNLGQKKLKTLIDQCTKSFMLMMKVPEEYTNEKCLEKTKKLTGLDIL